MLELYASFSDFKTHRHSSSVAKHSGLQAADFFALDRFKVFGMICRTFLYISYANLYTHDAVLHDVVLYTYG